MNIPTTWLQPFLVNTGAASPGIQGAPVITGLSNGNILVAWLDHNGNATPSPGQDILGKIYDAEGNVVRDTFQLNTVFKNGNQRDFDIAATNDGGFVVTYVDASATRPNQTRIDWERRDGDGKLTDADSIKYENLANAKLSNPQIALDLTDNSFMLTYTDSTAGNNDINAVFVDAQGRQSVEFNGAQNSTDSDSEGDLAILKDGNFVSVYEEVDGSLNGIEFRIFGSHGFGGNGTNLGNGSNKDPQVAALANGNFVVTWHAEDTENGNIEYAVLNSAGRVLVGPRSAAATTDSENEPEVVALPDGGFVILWDNDTDNTVEARPYDANGNSLDALLKIENINATAPNIGVTGDGRILFTWTSRNGDISASIWDPRGNTINAADYQKGRNNFVDADVITANTDATTINGSDRAERLIGSKENDLLLGFGGSDTIEGRNGNDTLHGGRGEDVLIGADGNDLLFGQSGSNSLIGGNGSDTLFGGELKDTLNGGTGNDKLAGGIGNDLLLAGAGSDSVFGGSGADTASGANGNDSMTGDAGNDRLSGGDGADTLSGGKGSDTLLGGNGSDSLQGGAGADTLNGGNGVDTLSGGSGNDRLLGGSGQDILLGGLGNDQLFGGAGNDTIDGGTGADKLIGNAGQDRMFGGKGSDSLFGGAGKDILRGDQGDDLLNGGAGLDTALFAGNKGRYNVTQLSPNKYKIVDTKGAFGTDTLSGVEKIAFSAGGTFDIDDLLA